MSVNKVILVGNVGKDPETRTAGNSQVSNLTLATSENYTSKTGEKVSNTEWHNIVAWGKLSEICEKYIKKGQQIYLEGSIKTRSWDDKDGVKRYTTEIIASSIQMLGGKKDSEEEKLPTYESPVKPNLSGLPPTEYATQPPIEDDPDGLPFDYIN